MRYYNIVALGLIILLITACSSGTTESIKEITDGEKATEQDSPHAHKQTKQITHIEEAELYRWKLDSDKEIVLTQKSGEIEINQAPSIVGDEGDKLYSGKAELYLVLDGMDEGYLEDEVELVMLNLDRTFANTYQFAGKTFFDIFIAQSSNSQLHQLWYFSQDNLKQITFDGEKELYSSNSTLKFIDNEYMQTIGYDNAGTDEHGIGWHFHTWLWEEAHDRFSEYDHQSYTSDQEYGWEIGEMIAEDWYEYNDYYVHFPRITFTKKDVELLRKGILVEKHVKIGDSIDGLVERMTRQSDYVEEDYYNGGLYYTFSTPYSYFYDEQGRNIHTIFMSGAALTNDTQSIRDLLGGPIDSGFSEMENLYIDQFIIGNYMITMEYDGDEIFVLTLSEKPEYIDS